MPNSGFKVIVTRKLPDTVQSRLKELFDVEFSQNDIPLSRNELLEAMKRADVLVPTLNDNIDASLLAEAGNRLKLLANYGSGVDHIDVEAAHKQGILVSNSPTISSSDTADMTIALILAVMRRFKESSNVMESGDWQGWAPSAFLGTRVSGKTIGILGMGRIGTALAERARAFGLNVHYHNRKKVHPDTETRLNAKYFKDCHTMLPEIDILATCCPLSDETHHILDTKALSLMKPTAVVVNTARGALIEEEALEAALLNGRLAAAGLDVLATGKNVNKTLCELPNVMLLPHMGSATH